MDGWMDGWVGWVGFGWRVESNANLDRDNHRRLLPSFFYRVIPIFSFFARSSHSESWKVKSNKKFISIWKDKIFLCIKKIRTRIYLLTVWNEARKIICKHNADTRRTEKGRKLQDPNSTAFTSLQSAERAEEMRGRFSVDLHINWCFLFGSFILRYIGKHFKHFPKNYTWKRIKLSDISWCWEKDIKLNR